MKLCLAGLCCAREKTKLIFDEIPFVLESFYYIRDFELPLIKNAELFLLDSGAFTFMNNAKTKVNWKEYIDKYIAFINKYDVKYFFELDVDVVLGYENVKKIRHYIEAKTGKKCIPVWHKSRGIDEFKKLVEEYEYISIGGIVTKEITKKEYPLMKRLVAYANRKGTKVHGLGFTASDVSDYGFYSVDSTSWLSLGRFGQLYKFTGKKIVNITPKNKGINRQMYVEGELHNIKEWIKFQNYLRKF